jgi:hypothetical protein
MAPRPARRRPSNAPSFADVKATIDAKEAAKEAAKKAKKTASAPKPLTPAQRYEQEKAARQAKGGKGYGGGYSAHLMGGNVRSSSYDRHSRRIVQEESDLYDIIFSYLLDEGYAETPESATAIMANMSEEWKESIFEEVFSEDYVPWDFGPKQKAKQKYDKLAASKKAGNSPPGTATRANKIASVARDMRTTLDRDSAATGADPKKQGLQPSTPRHTAAALRGAGGGTTARKTYNVKRLG